MKHLKRSDVRVNTIKAINDYYCECHYEDESEEKQINNAWETKEREEADRIKKEIDISWKEYEAEASSKDALDSEDNSIAEIEEYFQPLEQEKQVEPEVNFYPRNKKRSARRRATALAKKRLLKNAEIASDNFIKRAENDEKNICFHASEELNCRLGRLFSLTKRANRLQR